MASALDRIREAAELADGGAELVTLTTGDPLALLRSAATGQGPPGFVPLMASAASGRDLPDALRHRHLLVICADSAGAQIAAGWVRSLAQATPRRHVVVAVGGEEAERRAGEARAAAAGPFVTARLARANRWLRRGRARTADRWLRAAAEGARRRGDAGLAAQIEIQCARRWYDTDRVREAGDAARTLLRSDLGWSNHCAAAIVAADVLIAREQLHDARAWLTSLGTEARLRRENLPRSHAARLLELDFWQGRHRPPPARPLESLSVAELAWITLCAWSRGNLPTVAPLCGRLSQRSKDDGVAEWWTALLRLTLAGGAAGDDLADRADAVMRLCPGRACPPARLRRLALALTARAWLAHGQRDRAAAVLNSDAARGPGLEAVVCDRLRTLALPAADARDDVPGSRRRLAAPGVDFLALRSTTMHLVDGLTGLLAVIEDAEDDAAVLGGGCRWVCRQSGALAVAIVSADGSLLLAAEGWRRVDLSGEIAAILQGPARDVRLPEQDPTAPAFGVSVKYGGVAIGHVVARGRISERPALQQAAQALAALCGSALRARLDAAAAPQRARDALPEIVGDSPLMHSVREAITRAAPAPFPVLIEGESGTGKELVARALHRLGPRRDRRLCAVNCAALSDDLVEAELFGHTRGAFTGAVGPRTGLFEDASGGTLFLDEVTELSPRAQAKLLRALQEREIRRVGENAPRPVDVRVIAACNVPMAEAVTNGGFRDDLRFRLAVVRIRLPALRERIEDVPPLARLFWRRAAGEAGARAVLGPDALVRLTRYAWPGNVRELQNVIAGLVVAAPARGRVTGRHVDQVLAHVARGGEDPGVCLDAARRTFERRVIAAALVRHAGRRSAAALELGLTRQGLTKALRRLGLASIDDEHAAGVA